MRTNRLVIWVVLAVSAAAVAGVLFNRHAQNRRLRLELTAVRASVSRPTQATAERDQLGRQTNDRESDEAAVERVRAQIAGLTARLAERQRAMSTVQAVRDRPGRSIAETELPFDQWRNAGSRTPVDALETALWAASSGNVEELANLVSLDPEARTALNAMLLRLPAALRRDYGTPERMIALLTAPNVPQGFARVLDLKINDPRGVALAAVLRTEGSPPRVTQLLLRQEGEDWKLVVPLTAVKKYTAALNAPIPPRGER